MAERGRERVRVGKGGREGEREGRGEREREKEKWKRDGENIDRRDTENVWNGEREIRSKTRRKKVSVWN